MDASIVDVFEAKSTKLVDMVHGKTEAFTILPGLAFRLVGEARVHYIQTKGDNLRRISVGFPSTSPMLKLLLLDEESSSILFGGERLARLFRGRASPTLLIPLLSLIILPRQQTSSE